MNKIEKLIKEMCPNGVECKKLFEISNILKGEQLNKEKFIKDGQYPVYNGGQNNSGFYNKYNQEENSIILNQGGSAGLVSFIETKFWASAHCFVIKPKEKNFINNKFLFYLLKSKYNDILKLIHGTTIPGISIEDVRNLKINIPPIEIQNEIVKILDTFTQLEAELEAELEARDKQYQYYRNKLLDFDNNQKLLEKLFEKDSKGINNRIEYKQLKNIGVFYSGLSGKTKNDFFDKANSKYITYLNVFNNYSINFEILENVQININEKQNKIKCGDILFTTSSETLEECGISSVINKQVNGDVYLNSFCFGFRLNDLEKFDINYLKHLFKSKQLREQIIKCSNGVTRYNLSKTQFENVNIPIPSLEIQTKIANILDKLQDYSKDIKTGLPLEIEQRQKQYEYYRNLLLDFKANAQGGGISE